MIDARRSKRPPPMCCVRAPSSFLPSLSLPRHGLFNLIRQPSRTMVHKFRTALPPLLFFYIGIAAQQFGSWSSSIAASILQWQRYDVNSISPPPQSLEHTNVVSLDEKRRSSWQN